MWASLASVIGARSSRLNLGLNQSDVNVIFDLAPHDISIANHVLGAVPTSVRAWGSRHVDPVFEDVAFLRLGYDDIGVQAHIHVSWLDPRKVRLVTAVGSKKMAVYDDTNVEERIRVHDKAACVRTGAQPRTDGANGLAVVQVIEAAQLSLAEERTVLLDEVASEAVGHRCGLVPMPAQRTASAVPA